MIAFKEVSDDEAVLIVERLARQIWTEHFGPMIGMRQVEYMLKKFQCASVIKQYLMEGCKYYLVDLDGEPVGYAGIWVKADKGELFLSKLYLLSAHRGHGIGRQMMAFVKGMARDNGLKKIILNTNKKNIDTIRFYEKAGFVNKGSEVIDLGGGFVADDWLMEMAI